MRRRIEEPAGAKWTGRSGRGARRSARRATPSDDRLYERLFHDARVPDDVFTHVFSYWRTPRDFTYTPRDA